MTERGGELEKTNRKNGHYFNWDLSIYTQKYYTIANTTKHIHAMKREQ